AAGKKLTDDARAASSERETNGDFLLTRGGSRQRESGNVGAGDQQNESDDDHGDVKGWSNLAGFTVEARPRRTKRDGGSVLGLGERSRAVKHFVAENCSGVGLRLADGKARLETAEDDDPPIGGDRKSTRLNSSHL